METLLQLFDDADDFLFATRFRLRRLLSRRPRERRQVLRERPTMPSNQDQVLASKLRTQGKIDYPL